MGAEEAAIKTGSGLYPDNNGWQPGDHVAVSDQWYFSWRRRCHDGHEKFVARQYLQYYFMSVVDSWAWAHTGIWCSRCCNGNYYWAGHWCLLPVVSFV